MMNMPEFWDPAMKVPNSEELLRLKGGDSLPAGQVIVYHPILA